MSFNINYKEIHPFDFGVILDDLPENAIVVKDANRQAVEIRFYYKLTVKAPIETEEGKAIAKECGLL